MVNNEERIGKLARGRHGGEIEGFRDERHHFFTRTHLGSVLKVGDTALGYDLTNVQISDESFDSYVEKVGESRIPDVVLVKKSYAEKRKKRRDRGYRRAWELKRMDINEEEETNKKDDAEKRMQDEELFMQELEEDFEGRAQINVYKKKNEDLDAVIRANQNALANETDDEDDDENDEIPEIKLEELLDDMKLSDVEEEEEEEEEETFGTMEIHYVDYACVINVYNFAAFFVVVVVGSRSFFL